MYSSPYIDDSWESHRDFLEDDLRKMKRWALKGDITQEDYMYNFEIMRDYYTEKVFDKMIVEIEDWKLVPKEYSQFRKQIIDRIRRKEKSMKRIFSIVILVIIVIAIALMFFL